MTDVISSVLEFKPVGNLHFIVNKSSTFSFDQMTGDGDDFKFVPCSACQDSWKSNINQTNYQLDYSKVTLCKNITSNSSSDVEPPTVKLYAEEVGYGGVIVTLHPNNTSSTITLGSEVQELKAIFLVSDETECVLAYCILPEPIKVNNYLQLNYTEPIIEITSTVHTPNE